MRRPVIAASIFALAVLMPRLGAAQIYPQASPLPQVTAAAADWQRAGEPVFHAGAFYRPSGPTIHFDGEVMRPTGMFKGVLLYEDPTVEPGSRVYVPVGQKLMRPYERRRDGGLAGPADWWMPWQPAQRSVEMYDAPREFGSERAMYPGEEPRFSVDEPIGAEAAVREPPLRSEDPTGVESIPAPRSSDGVWIVFEGDRWYSDGKAERFSADRFTPAGNYRGFPVYRDTNAAADRIFVTVVADGPVAPYARR